MKRLYSLFAKIDGKFVRISVCSYRLDLARRLYQNRLLMGTAHGVEMRLKPVKPLPWDNRLPIEEQIESDFQRWLMKLEAGVIRPKLS